MSNLGTEIIFAEILPRLPAKSLKRFKCVSKSFETFISSPYFTKLYTRYNPSQLLILPEDGRIICYDLDSTAAVVTFTWQDGGLVNFIGSANGLLCVCTPKKLSVLNPTTRFYQDIRVPISMDYITDLDRYPYERLRGGAGRFLGFGFDHKNNDFKIVGVSDGKQNDAIKIRVTKVYSLNNDSWTVVEREVHTDSMEGSWCGGTLINSHLLHWMFWNYSLCNRRIGCFDVCKNKWVDDVLLPRYYYDTTNRNLILLKIGLLNDLLFSFFERVQDCYDVWVLNEYGVQDSWVKLFSIPLPNGLPGVVPVASRGFRDILVRQCRSTRLFWYNLIEGGMTHARFDGAPDFSKHKVYMCGRNPVDLPRGKLFGDQQEISG